MGYAFSQWFWSFAGELLVAVIIGGAAMIWGIFEGVKRWSAAVNGIVVMAAILLIINQSGWWEPPVKVKVHQWLDDMAFSIRDMPLTERENFEFRYEVSFMDLNNQNIRFYVQRPKNSMNGFLIMEIGYSALESHPSVKQLSKKQEISLRRHISRDLSLTGVLLIEKGGDWSLRMQYIIPLASMTHYDFQHGYFALVKSLNLVHSNIGIALED